MKRKLKLAFLVAAMSLTVIVVEVVGALILGLGLYVVLDQILAPDTLGSFLGFGALAVVVGPPAVIGASALVVLKRAPHVAVLLCLLPFVLGVLGFAGFFVAAMGI